VVQIQYYLHLIANNKTAIMANNPASDAASIELDTLHHDITVPEPAWLRDATSSLLDDPRNWGE